jgi:single-strand DNA-binding protein
MTAITITGNLVADPEIKFSKSGKAIAKFRVADTVRKQVNGEWQDDGTTFWRCTAFGKLAENIGDSLSKGQRVIVVGRAKTEEWTTKEGDKRSQIEIMANSVGPDLMRNPVRIGESAKPAPVDDVWGVPKTDDADMPF